MKTISNANYALAMRLLEALARIPGRTVRESENARIAGLLVKKLKRKEAREHE